MTTIFEEEVPCAICGSKQTVQEIGSTNTFGAMDLDTRPPEMKRSTMRLWVHECEQCGYVAPELGTAPDGAGRIVASAEYRAELNNPSRVKLSNRFVCRALLEGAPVQRRAALEFCAEGLALPEVPAFVTKLLLYQHELAQARDIGRPRVAKGFGGR